MSQILGLKKTPDTVLIGWLLKKPKTGNKMKHYLIFTSYDRVMLRSTASVLFARMENNNDIDKFEKLT